MRILILAVGRDRKGPSVELVADYVKRCPWRIELIELLPRRRGTPSQRLFEEAEKLRQLVPKQAALIALDEGGEDLDSRAFAERISGFQLEGRSALCFVIGSADGLDPALTRSADLRLAFGRATWPHRLVRAMLTEQIYRASTILSGHPYHRD